MAVTADKKAAGISWRQRLEAIFSSGRQEQPEPAALLAALHSPRFRAIDGQRGRKISGHYRQRGWR